MSTEFLLQASDEPIYLLYFIDPDPESGSNWWSAQCSSPIFTIAVMIKQTTTSSAMWYRRHLRLMSSRSTVYTSGCCTYIAFAESSSADKIGMIGNGDNKIVIYEFMGTQAFQCVSTNVNILPGGSSAMLGDKRSDPISSAQ